MEGLVGGAEVAIRTGRLLPGYQELSEGVNAPVRGIAATDNGEISVIAKKVGSRVLAVELICAAYGRAAGLPIPEPLILIDEKHQFHFGSADTGHPSLAHFVNAEDASLIKTLSEWPGLVAAACFDELVVNPDRHDGNLLYDGESFTLIDHDLCLPHGMQPESTFGPEGANILLKILIDSIPTDELSKRRALKEIEAWIADKSDISMDGASLALNGACTPDTQNQLLSFIKARLIKLADLLNDKVKPEQRRLEY